MSELKRIPVKYVRDYIKKFYKYDTKCYICSSTDSLELHHLYSISELWNVWIETNKYKVDTYEAVKSLREDFYRLHLDLLSEKNLFTLCRSHHEKLHSIYGQRYSNWRSQKVKEWIEVQKTKFGDNDGKSVFMD